MRKFCRRTLALALAALLAAPASGCSFGIGSQTVAVPSITAQTEISNEESKTEESKDTGEPATIRLVHYVGEQARRDVLDAMLAALSKVHSETKVSVEVAASSPYTATHKNYIVAGEVLNTVFGKPQIMQEFVDGGYFMDLRNETYMTSILLMLVDECTVNDGVYGSPVGTQIKATFYNKKMSQEAGAEIPTIKGELSKVCDTFTDQGVYSSVHPYNFIHDTFHELDSFFTNMTAVTGNENMWMDPQNGVRDLFGNPAVVEAMEMLPKSASYKDIGDTTVDQIQGIQNFATG